MRRFCEPPGTCVYWKYHNKIHLRKFSRQSNSFFLYQQFDRYIYLVIVEWICEYAWKKMRYLLIKMVRWKYERLWLTSECNEINKKSANRFSLHSPHSYISRSFANSCIVFIGFDMLRLCMMIIDRNFCAFLSRVFRSLVCYAWNQT